MRVVLDLPIPPEIQHYLLLLITFVKTHILGIPQQQPSPQQQQQRNPPGFFGRLFGPPQQQQQHSVMSLSTKTMFVFAFSYFWLELSVLMGVPHLFYGFSLLNTLWYLFPILCLTRIYGPQQLRIGSVVCYILVLFMLKEQWLAHADISVVRTVLHQSSSAWPSDGTGGGITALGTDDIDGGKLFHVSAGHSLDGLAEASGSCSEFAKVMKVDATGFVVKLLTAAQAAAMQSSIEKEAETAPSKSSRTHTDRDDDDDNYLEAEDSSAEGSELAKEITKTTKETLQSVLGRSEESNDGGDSLEDSVSMMIGSAVSSVFLFPAALVSVFFGLVTSAAHIILTSYMSLAVFQTCLDLSNQMKGRKADFWLMLPMLALVNTVILLAIGDDYEGENSERAADGHDAGGLDTMTTQILFSIWLMVSLSYSIRSSYLVQAMQQASSILLNEESKPGRAHQQQETSGQKKFLMKLLNLEMLNYDDLMSILRVMQMSEDDVFAIDEILVMKIQQQKQHPQNPEGTGSTTDDGHKRALRDEDEEDADLGPSPRSIREERERMAEIIAILPDLFLDIVTYLPLIVAYCNLVINFIGVLLTLRLHKSAAVLSSLVVLVLFPLPSSFVPRRTPGVSSGNRVMLKRIRTRKLRRLLTPSGFGEKLSDMFIRFEEWKHSCTWNAFPITQAAASHNNSNITPLLRDQWLTGAEVSAAGGYIGHQEQTVANKVPLIWALILKPSVGMKRLMMPFVRLRLGVHLLFKQQDLASLLDAAARINNEEFDLNRFLEILILDEIVVHARRGKILSELIKKQQQPQQVAGQQPAPLHQQALDAFILESKKKSGPSLLELEQSTQHLLQFPKRFLEESTANVVGGGEVSPSASLSVTWHSVVRGQMYMQLISGSERMEKEKKDYDFNSRDLLQKKGNENSPSTAGATTDMAGQLTSAAPLPPPIGGGFAIDQILPRAMGHYGAVFKSTRRMNGTLRTGAHCAVDFAPDFVTSHILLEHLIQLLTPLPDTWPSWQLRGREAVIRIFRPAINSFRTYLVWGEGPGMKWRLPPAKLKFVAHHHPGPGGAQLKTEDPPLTPVLLAWLDSRSTCAKALALYIRSETGKIRGFLTAAAQERTDVFSECWYGTDSGTEGCSEGADQNDHDGKQEDTVALEARKKTALVHNLYQSTREQGDELDRRLDLGMGFKELLSLVVDVTYFLSKRTHRTQLLPHICSAQVDLLEACLDRLSLNDGYWRALIASRFKETADDKCHQAPPQVLENRATTPHLRELDGKSVLAEMFYIFPIWMTDKNFIQQLPYVSSALSILNTVLTVATKNGGDDYFQATGRPGQEMLKERTTKEKSGVQIYGATISSFVAAAQMGSDQFTTNMHEMGDNAGSTQRTQNPVPRAMEILRRRTIRIGLSVLYKICQYFERAQCVSAFRNNDKFVQYLFHRYRTEAEDEEGESGDGKGDNTNSSKPSSPTSPSTTRPSQTSQDQRNSRKSQLLRLKVIDRPVLAPTKQEIVPKKITGKKLSEFLVQYAQFPKSVRLISEEMLRELIKEKKVNVPNESDNCVVCMAPLVGGGDQKNNEIGSKTINTISGSVAASGGGTSSRDAQSTGIGGGQAITPENATLGLLAPCGHVLHRDCLFLWLLSHKECPYCRKWLSDEPPGTRSGGGGLPMQQQQQPPQPDQPIVAGVDGGAPAGAPPGAPNGQVPQQQQPQQDAFPQQFLGGAPGVVAAPQQQPPQGAAAGGFQIQAGPGGQPLLQIDPAALPPGPVNIQVQQQVQQIGANGVVPQGGPAIVAPQQQQQLVIGGGAPPFGANAGGMVLPINFQPPGGGGGFGGMIGQQGGVQMGGRPFGQ